MTDDEVLKILTALGDSVRFEIFRKVGEHPGVSASELRSGKSAATVSHHVKVLVDAHLLTVTKDGRRLRYKLNSGTLERFAVWAVAMSERATFDQLSRYLHDTESD